MITLHPDEKIIHEKRRFWLPIALQGIASFFVGFSPFLIVFVFKEFLPQQLQELFRTYQIPTLFFLTAWVLVVWMVYFIRWTDYYLDILLITNKRLFDIEQLGLFSRDISETRLQNIQDMRVEIAGLLASMMNFGNLYIQTAGAANEFVIRNIHEPNKVKDIISHECECLEEEKQEDSREQQSEIQPPATSPSG